MGAHPVSAAPAALVGLGGMNTQRALPACYPKAGQQESRDGLASRYLVGQAGGWGHRQATSRGGQLFPLQMKTVAPRLRTGLSGGPHVRAQKGRGSQITKSGPVLPPSTHPTGSSLSRQAPGLDASCQNTQTSHMAMEPVPNHSQPSPSLHPKASTSPTKVNKGTANQGT